MGLICKPISKLESIIRKMENKLEGDKKAYKNKKKDEK